jgi:hypothetical protein
VLTEEELGGIAALLALEFPTWVQRRIERITYLDRSTIRWSEGVLIKWPTPDFFDDHLEQPLQSGERIYIPLDLLTKEPLTGLDGTRPGGSPFPILPYGRSTAMALDGVIAQIWTASQKVQNGAGLKVESIEQLTAIVIAPPELASRLLKAVLDPNSGSELSLVLADHSQYRGLLEELALNVMFLAPAIYKPEKEVVYRYSYCQSLPRKDGLLARFASSFGFRDITMLQERLSLGWCHSYHFEVDAPPEVRISCAKLWLRYGPKPEPDRDIALIAEAGGSPVIDLHARRPTQEVLASEAAADPKQRPPVLPALPDHPTVQQLLDASNEARATATERSDQGEAKMRMRLDAGGTFFVAMVVSCLTAVLLYWARTRLVRLDGQTAAAVLLALPIITLGYLTRPGEHSLATRLLSGIRLLALLVGICSLIVAAILAGGFVEHKGGKGPGYSCTSQIDDLPVHKSAHVSWRRTADPDRTQLDCRIVPGGASKASLDPVAQEAANFACWFAFGFAVVLLLGWVSTCLRPSGMRRKRRWPAAS